MYLGRLGRCALRRAHRYALRLQQGARTCALRTLSAPSEQNLLLWAGSVRKAHYTRHADKHTLVHRVPGTGAYRNKRRPLSRRIVTILLLSSLSFPRARPAATRRGSLIGWQRLGGFTFRRKIDHTSLHIKTSIPESRPPSGKRGRGAQTSSSNTEPVLETTHDEHLVGVHRETDSPRKGVKRTLSRMT